MFNDKIIDKFSNYWYYFVGSTNQRREVDEGRLRKIIGDLRNLLQKPYLQFIYASNKPEAVCFVIEKGKRLTKLVTLSQVEEMIAEGNFDKYPSHAVEVARQK